MKEIKHYDTYLTINGKNHLYLIFSDVSGMPVTKEEYDKHKGYKTCKPTEKEIDHERIRRNSAFKPKHLFMP